MILGIYGGNHIEIKIISTLIFLETIWLMYIQMITHTHTPSVLLVAVTMTHSQCEEVVLLE